MKTDVYSIEWGWFEEWGGEDEYSVEDYESAEDAEQEALAAFHDILEDMSLRIPDAPDWVRMYKNGDEIKYWDNVPF